MKGGNTRDSRVHVEDPPHLRCVMIYNFRDIRPWSDKTHIPLNHIDQLREFIQLGSTENPPDWGYPGIVSGRNRCSQGICPVDQVRNLKTWNIRSLKPTRSCLKNIGPADVVLTISATTPIRGAASTRPMQTRMRSKNLFNINNRTS